jgi:hypothetical protein
MASYSNPTPDTHVEVLERQTFNSIGAITALGLTQDNKVGNAQKVANSRLAPNTPKGILAGSVVAVAGDTQIGPCLGDSTLAFDKAVGIAINNALGNPYESSSAIASGKVVYAHGTGTVLRTDIYETANIVGGTLAYTAGQKLYSSQNGLLVNAMGYDTTFANATLIGILLTAPSPADLYMTVQLRI